MYHIIHTCISRTVRRRRLQKNIIDKQIYFQSFNQLNLLKATKFLKNYTKNCFVNIVQHFFYPYLTIKKYKKKGNRCTVQKIGVCFIYCFIKINNYIV